MILRMMAMLLAGFMLSTRPAASQLPDMGERLEDLAEVVKAKLGIEDEEIPVITTLGEAQPGTLLPAGHGLEVWFDAPEALVNAPQGHEFVAKDLHSPAVIRGRVTDEKTFWRGSKIQITSVELLGQSQRLAVKPMVFQGKEIQSFKLIKDVQIAGRTLIGTIKGTLIVIFDRPFRSAFALHGLAGFIMALFVWHRCTRGSWRAARRRMRQSFYWTVFNLGSVPLLVLGTYLAGRHFYVSPPVGWHWMAGGLCGFTISFVGLQRLTALAGLPLIGNDDSGRHVGPLPMSGPLNRPKTEPVLPGTSDDW